MPWVFYYLVQLTFLAKVAALMGKKNGWFYYFGLAEVFLLGLDRRRRVRRLGLYPVLWLFFNLVRCSWLIHSSYLWLSSNIRSIKSIYTTLIWRILWRYFTIFRYNMADKFVLVYWFLLLYSRCCLLCLIFTNLLFRLLVDLTLDRTRLRLSLINDRQFLFFLFGKWPNIIILA